MQLNWFDCWNSNQILRKKTIIVTRILWKYIVSPYKNSHFCEEVEHMKINDRHHPYIPKKQTTKYKSIIINISCLTMSIRTFLYFCMPFLYPINYTFTISLFISCIVIFGRENMSEWYANTSVISIRRNIQIEFYDWQFHISF